MAQVWCDFPAAPGRERHSVRVTPHSCENNHPSAFDIFHTCVFLGMHLEEEVALTEIFHGAQLGYGGPQDKDRFP